jgi:hypothetical protein
MTGVRWMWGMILVGAAWMSSREGMLLTKLYGG